MSENNTALLDQVGRRLVEEFANRLTDHLADLVDGMKYADQPWYQRKYGMLSTLTDSQQAAVQALIDEVAPAALHALLDLIEQDKFRDPSEPGRLSLQITDAYGRAQDVAQASDGLSGEIYSDAGWLARFSNRADRAAHKE
ncbi:MAG: hypothetical protein ABIR04_14090 [Cypionkella sp.]